MQYEQMVDGAAVVVALIGESNILLVRNMEHPDPKWKLIAETNKPGESILHTLVSGLEEEAGMEKIETKLGSDGKIVSFIDPRIKEVVQLGEPERVNSRIPHFRHFYGVRVADELIHELSGKVHLTEERNGEGKIEGEHLETKEFALVDLDDLGKDLLRQHAELIRSIPGRTRSVV